MKSLVAIDIVNLSKCFHLYRSPLDRLKEAFHPLKKKFYSDFFALQNVSLSIPTGQTWGIIGLNGSGKSTLLKLVCGILQPSSGSVTVNGTISALLELGSGFNPEFTGRQNVYFAGALAGVDRRQMNRCFDEIVAFAEIGDFLDQPTKNYSSGMLVRLAFAVAVNINPDILIIDEALAVGDSRFQHKCMAKIKSFQKNSTILIVSHDQNAIMTLCDKVAWLHEGKLVAIGKPKEIMQRYIGVIYEGMGNGAVQEEICSADVEEMASRSAENSFGVGKANISCIRLRSLSRGDIEMVYGGEEVALEILVEAREDIAKPLVGFLVKNRLGIELFGDNNLTLEKEISSLAAGTTATISFSFKWPLLAAGSYAITAAIADGTSEGHQQQHWVHDMLVVEVAPQKGEVGLFNLDNITFEVIL